MLPVGKQGKVTVTAATESKVTASIDVAIEASPALPERSTEAGAVARLLMSEARGPADPHYSEADTLEGMQWIKRVLVNRLNDKPERFVDRPHSGSSFKKRST
jgi:hypothetical protein